MHVSSEANGRHEDTIRKERKKSKVFHVSILSYIHMGAFCREGNFLPWPFANFGGIRIQLWQENLVHWIFVVRKWLSEFQGKGKRILDASYQQFNY